MTKTNPLPQEERLKKRTKLLEKNLNPYPHAFKRTHLAAQVKDQYAHLKEEGGDSSKEEVVCAGRLMLLRKMGKASFFHIQDPSGLLQCYVKTEALDPESKDRFSLVDIGDILGLKGSVFRTRKGELTLRCTHFYILCKSLQPLPEKYHGLEDTELKYRKRYLDLIMNTESRKVFFTRSRVIKEIRKFLDRRGFLEVSSPVLQPLYGGARAEPFFTHHRALDQKFYLKISPELYLKRLIVGGMEKVYELGSNFRNEGIDRLHNPEFTMLEYYEAYTDYQDQMKQFEELICHIVKEVKGSLKVSYQGRELDFTPPWERLSILEGLKKYGQFDVQEVNDQDLFKKIKDLGSDLRQEVPRGQMILEAFELAVEKKLFQPVFVMDFPLETSPLTKSHRRQAGWVERFEPYVAGMELGNAYTELNDPVEQRKRLKEQEALRVVDKEAQPMDEDFAQAMEVGMPPTGGVGLGVERLVLLLTDQPSLKDIILFPTLKQKK